MRHNTITNLSTTVKSRSSVSLTVVGNVVRAVLDLTFTALMRLRITFMREHSGYAPLPSWSESWPALKCQSPRVGDRCFAIGMVRRPGA